MKKVLFLILFISALQGKTLESDRAGVMCVNYNLFFTGHYMMAPVFHSSGSGKPVRCKNAKKVNGGFSRNEHYIIEIYDDGFSRYSGLDK